MSCRQRVSIRETTETSTPGRKSKSTWLSNASSVAHAPGRLGSVMRREQPSMDTLRCAPVSGVRTPQNDLRAAGQAASLPPKTLPAGSLGARSKDACNKAGSNATAAKRSFSASFVAKAKALKDRCRQSLSAVRSKVQTQKSDKTICSRSSSETRVPEQDQLVQRSQGSRVDRWQSSNKNHVQQERSSEVARWVRNGRSQSCEDFRCARPAQTEPICRSDLSSKCWKSGHDCKSQSNNGAYPNLLSGRSPFENKHTQVSTQKDNYKPFLPAARVAEEKHQGSCHQSLTVSQRIKPIEGKQLGQATPRLHIDSCQANKENHPRLYSEIRLSGGKQREEGIGIRINGVDHWFDDVLQSLIAFEAEQKRIAAEAAKRRWAVTSGHCEREDAPLRAL